MSTSIMLRGLGLGFAARINRPYIELVTISWKKTTYFDRLLLNMIAMLYSFIATRLTNQITYLFFYLILLYKERDENMENEMGKTSM